MCSPAASTREPEFPNGAITSLDNLSYRNYDLQYARLQGPRCRGFG
jgi:hypothetical protein